MEEYMSIRKRLKLIADYIGWESPLLTRNMALSSETRPLTRESMLERVNAGEINGKMLKFVTDHQFDRLVDLGLEFSKNLDIKKIKKTTLNSATAQE